MGYFLLGAVMIYSFIHTIFLQSKGWEDRTQYEKAVTIAGFITGTITLLATAGY